MIVVDEQLQGLGLEEAIRRWYGGRVCLITALRPGTVIKDEAVPGLLQAASQPTFVTLNWRHFWRTTRAHPGFCLVCFTLPTDRATEVSSLLRRLCRMPVFKTKAARMGKVARVGDDQVTYYQANDVDTYVLPLS